MENQTEVELKQQIDAIKASMIGKTKNTKEYALQYYHSHNVPLECECGKMSTTFSIYKHRMSRKHLQLMEILKLEKRVAELQAKEKEQSGLICLKVLVVDFLHCCFTLGK